MSPYGSGNPGNPEYRPSPKVRFEAIGEAWQMFTQQMGTWISALLILFGIIFAVYMVFGFGVFGLLIAAGGSRHAGEAGAALGMLFLAELVMGLVMLTIAAYMTGGLIRMALKQVRGAPISISDLFSGGDVFLPVLGATLLCALAAGAASLLFVIPGWIVAGLLFLTIPLIVDQKMGVIEAMTTSWNALKSDWLMATLFALVMPLIAGLGALACGVGALFTYPLLYLGMAVLYRDFFMNAPTSQFNPSMPYPPPTGGNYPPPTGTNYPPPMGYNAPPPMEPSAPPTMDYNAPPPMQTDAPPTMEFTPPPPMQAEAPPSMDFTPPPPLEDNIPLTMETDAPPAMDLNTPTPMETDVPPTGVNYPPATFPDTIPPPAAPDNPPPPADSNNPPPPTQ